MNPYQSHANAFGATQDLLGDDCPIFTWNGTDYKTIPNTALLKKNLGYGGFQLDSDLKIWTLAAPFITTAIPDVITLKAAMLETFMSYLGYQYKITAVNVLGGATIIQIDANDANQGA